MGSDNAADKQQITVIGKPFPKGVSGNPAGRPKRKTLTELIHAKLDDTPEAWEAIVAMVIQKLLKDRDGQVLKTFWEYTDGKPKQTIELENKADQIQQVKKLIDDEVQTLGKTLPQEPNGGTVPAVTEPGENI